jgi:putative Mg2+ transporter-C (MgtC) family protein
VELDVVSGYPEVFLRLAAATMLGAALGIDRELRGKPAGMRTHALVALGAAVMTLLGIHVGLAATPIDSSAISRVIQGIIAGVGFLGGGAILKGGSEGDVRGLTTAASIWVVAALGIACGAGAWFAAAITIALAVITLVFGNFLERVVRRLLGPAFHRFGSWKEE